jgi:hypothetical protein
MNFTFTPIACRVGIEGSETFQSGFAVTRASMNWFDCDLAILFTGKEFDKCKEWPHP